MRLAFFDFGNAFYRPLVTRIVILALVVIWAGVEFFAGSTGWALIFLGLSAYVGWGFFLSGQVGEPKPETNGKGEGNPAEPGK